jgi:hypothetical protein
MAGRNIFIAVPIELEAVRAQHLRVKGWNFQKCFGRKPA